MLKNSSTTCALPHSLYKAITGGNNHFAFGTVLTLLGKATNQKTSFRILVGAYRHNIPTHTPQSG